MFPKRPRSSPVIRAPRSCTNDVVLYLRVHTTAVNGVRPPKPLVAYDILAILDRQFKKFIAAVRFSAFQNVRIGKTPYFYTISSILIHSI
jgi:hypothetical protein